MTTIETNHFIGSFSDEINNAYNSGWVVILQRASISVSAENLDTVDKVFL